MTSSANVLMVAAENDALPGGKVGGVADVVRDVPPAMAAPPEFDGTVSVVCPSYGFLHEEPVARLGSVAFSFGGQQLEAELFEVTGKRPHTGVRQLVLHHEKFQTIDAASGRKLIYVDDGAEHPFASDASKFACFNAAVTQGLLQGVFGDVDIVHLHDWHTGFYLLLREFDPALQPLREKRTVFTIHNLALQGTRPFRGERSSLENWYPDLKYEEQALRDPEYTGCVNPMAVGIRYGDKVHVVSPGYVSEVCQPSRPRRSAPDCVFFGGEGLEQDLQTARDQGRLVGILNGCEYPGEWLTVPPRDEAAWKNLLACLAVEVTRWFEKSRTPRHWLALQRLNDWMVSGQPRPEVVMTSVTRVVDQKVRLMRTPEVAPPVDRILSECSDDAVYILAGSGDRGYESFLDSMARRHPNFIFLNGYSQPAADHLYAAGDLFLMPSAFEPCGISQMLAMRDGQPCVVHAIGGLKDTVEDGVTGFSFEGSTPEDLGEAFVATVRRAVALKRKSPEDFRRIQEAAFSKRFLWENSVRSYLTDLYGES